MPGVIETLSNLHIHLCRNITTWQRCHTTLHFVNHNINYNNNQSLHTHMLFMSPKCVHYGQPATRSPSHSWALGNFYLLCLLEWSTILNKNTPLRVVTISSLRWAQHTPQCTTTNFCFFTDASFLPNTIINCGHLATIITASQAILRNHYLWYNSTWHYARSVIVCIRNMSIH